MDLHLQDKVIIVTGGAKGIGEAISRSLAAEGAIPVIVGRSGKEGEALASELSTGKMVVLNIVEELRDAAACERVVAQTVQQYGRIDGLVNNAGVNDGIGLASGSPEKFMASLQLNLSHYYYMAHYALPHLKMQIHLFNILKSDM